MMDAARCYPVGFVKESTRWAAVAILGLRYGENMFVSDSGQWLGQYLPVALRSYPFVPVDVGEGQDAKTVLGLVEGDERVVVAGQGGTDESEKRFFEEDGNLTAFTGGMQRLIGQIVKHRALTGRVIAELEELGLLAPWRLPLREEGSDRSVNVDGVYCVDEHAFEQLSDEAFLKLRRTGALPFVYAHLMSTGLITRLENTLDPVETGADDDARGAGRYGSEANSLFEFY